MRGSSAKSRRTEKLRVVTAAQIAKARTAKKGTHPRVVTAMPLAPLSPGMLRG